MERALYEPSPVPASRPEVQFRPKSANAKYSSSHAGAFRARPTSAPSKSDGKGGGRQQYSDLASSSRGLIRLQEDEEAHVANDYVPFDVDYLAMEVIGV